MKTTHTKSIMLLVSAALLLTASIVGTFAYLTDHSDPVKNQFDPVRVPIEVEENFSGTTKSNVTIKNNGNIDAYIRAAIIVTWQDSAGNIYPQVPVEGENNDYTLGTGSDWTYNETDGYYYYKGIVAADPDEDGPEPGGLTGILIAKAEPVANAAPEGYQLSVEILAQSIQTEPDAAVQEAWGMSYSATDGWTKAN